MPRFKKQDPKTKWVRIRVRDEDYQTLQELVMELHGEYVLNFYAYEVINYAARDLTAYARGLRKPRRKEG